MPSKLYTILLLGAALALPASGQDSTTVPVTVKGVAFDSLRGGPLAEAVIMIAGLDRRVTTDARGRFEFDSVPPGPRTFQVQHASLDSIGFHGFARQFAITTGSANVVLAFPSFRTLWAAACDGAPKRDSGFVYGTISEAAGRGPVADATVELSWIETTYDKQNGVRQRRHRVETRSNANGTYVVCGVPMPHWFRLEASTASGEQGTVDLPPHNLLVERRNLLIAPASVDSAHFGRIAGVLTDENGYPYSEARVIVDDSLETRTDGEGRFAFHHVPAGTRRVQILSLGTMPLVTTVDVFPGMSAGVTHQLRRVTTLDVVRVIGTNRGRVIAEQLEERRKTGFGYTMDMTELAAHASLETALREMPGATMVRQQGDFALLTSDGRGGQCTASVWVDGARMAVAALNMIHPREIMVIEFFPRPSVVPMQFRGLDRESAICGAVVVWTRWAFGK
ncbi:MAG: carboxypeptidase regulatory-like domain-containing protein [Gemmatimonadaceae bacterium]